MRALAIRTDAESDADEHEFQTLARLLAAGSLHRLQDRPQRDELLQKVFEQGRAGVAPVDEGARMLAAEWALDDRDGARAEGLLADMSPGVARRTQALRLKLQLARLTRRSTEALYTARLLAKHQAFSAVAALGLLRSLAFEVLDDAHDIEQLRRAWQQLDAMDRRDPVVAARGARRAALLGVPADGRLWLQPHWDRIDELDSDGRSQVALALMDCCEGVGADWLPRIEAAQRTHANESAVQAAAGAVLMSCQLWGKARRPLEQAANDVALEPRARRQAWRQLAKLAREQDDEVRAADCERSAAAVD
jgi:HemY protein